jgi:hypothetical protein
VNLVTSAGFGLIAVAFAQTVAWIVEGLSYKGSQPQGVAGDTLHRLGFPFFGTQSAIALLLLLVGTVLVSLPPVLHARPSQQQRRLVTASLWLAVLAASTIAIGSVLAVRANLHVYAAQDRGVPDFVRIQLTGFLLVTLGTAAVALFGAVVAMGLRDGAD